MRKNSPRPRAPPCPETMVSHRIHLFSCRAHDEGVRRHDAMAYGKTRGSVCCMCPDVCARSTGWTWQLRDHRNRGHPDSGCNTCRDESRSGAHQRFMHSWCLSQHSQAQWREGSLHGCSTRPHVLFLQLVVDLLRQQVLKLDQKGGCEGNAQHRQAELSVPVLVPRPREIRIRRLSKQRGNRADSNTVGANNMPPGLRLLSRAHDLMLHPLHCLLARGGHANR